MLIVSLMLWSACTTPTVWTHTTKTQQDLAKDRYECEQEAAVFVRAKMGTLVFMPDLVIPKEIDKRTAECLRVRGWQAKETPPQWDLIHPLPQ